MVERNRRRRREKVGTHRPDPPPPVRGRAAGPKPPPMTAPASAGSTAGSASKKAAAGKSAGQKAARPQGAGAGVPPDRPLKASKKRKKAAIRRRLPHTAAVGVTVVPGWDGEVPSFTDILKRAKALVPDVNARFGIRDLHARRSATDDLLLEIRGSDASRKADNLAEVFRNVAREIQGFALPGRSKR